MEFFWRPRKTCFPPIRWPWTLHKNNDWENSITEMLFHNSLWLSREFSIQTLPHFQFRVKHTPCEENAHQTTRISDVNNSLSPLSTLSAKQHRKKNIFTNKSKLKRCIRLRWERIFPPISIHSKDAHRKDIVLRSQREGKKIFQLKTKKKEEIKKSFLVFGA